MKKNFISLERVSGKLVVCDELDEVSVVDSKVVPVSLDGERSELH